MSRKEKFVFGKDNYMFILIGMAVTFIGFLLMIGGASTDPNVFNKEELFSSTRITIAPLMVLAGYGLVIYGIMKKRKVQE